MMKTEDLKQALLRRRSKTPVQARDLLSSGSTLLNLACTGKHQGAFVPGRYYLIVGDSASGKSFLTLTCLAEACLNKRYKDYRLIYDNAEAGADMDWEAFFGKETKRRVETVASQSVEEFYYRLDDLADKPYIYILDSMDALTTGEEGDKFREQKTAHRKGKTAAGSYGTSKAKLNSSSMRVARSNLEAAGSILIVISQTRDKLDFGFEKKTRAGGHALRFYATCEIWTSIVKQLRTEHRGNPVQQGIMCKAEVKKNRSTGRHRSVEIPIYHSKGIDDTGSCVDFLTEWKHWQAGKGIVEATEFNFTGHREKLIKLIEEGNKEDELREIVAEAWHGIETATAVDRKNKYI